MILTIAGNSAPFSIVLIRKVVSIEPKRIAKESMTVNLYNENVKRIFRFILA